jgi:hypothetical protein
LVLFINHNVYGAICPLECQAPAIDTSIPKFDFSRARRLPANLNSFFFVRRCPPHNHTALLLVPYLSPYIYIIKEGLRGLTKIMTPNEIRTLRCISFFAHRTHFNTYGVLCKCLARSIGCRWLTSTELQFLQVSESPSPPRGPRSFSCLFWRAVISVLTLSSGLTAILLVFKIVDEDEELGQKVELKRLAIRLQGR